MKKQLKVNNLQLKENNKMEYLYAAMLLHKAGQDISEANLKKTLTAAGVKVDDARVKATVTALNDVDIEKVLAETTIAAPVASGAAPSSDAAPAEKKEEKKEEAGASEEEAAAGLGALFG
jgi:large subunit ribosomal protein L12